MAQVTAQLHPSSMIGVKENVVDTIFELEPFSTPFLQEIGAGPDGNLNTLSRPCTSQTYTWPERSLTTNRTTLAAAMTSGQTTMDIVTADHGFLRAGDRVLVDRELITITSIASGDPDVIVRGVGGTSAATHDAGAVVVNLGNAKLTGAAISSTVLGDEPTIITNYTEIFSEDIFVSGSAQAVEAYGRRDPYSDYMTQVMRRLKEQLEHRVLFGGTAVQPSAGSTAGRMAGGLTFITENTRNLNGAQVTKEDVLRVLEGIDNAGGKADMLLCGSFNASVIDSWKDSAIRYVSSEATGGTYGATVGMLATRFGDPKIVVKRTFPQSLIMIVTTANVAVGPLNGNGNDRAFHTVEVGIEGDRRRGFVLGEYTCEWRLPKTHGLIYGTSVA